MRGEQLKYCEFLHRQFGRRDNGEVSVRELIQRNRLVVERRRLQNDGRRADETGDDEDPQEETVQHHGHEFPVLDDFDLPVRVFRVFGDELDAPQSAADIRRQ